MAANSSTRHDEREAASSSGDLSSWCESSSVTDEAATPKGSPQSMWACGLPGAPPFPRIARMQLGYIEEVPVATGCRFDKSQDVGGSELFEAHIRPYAQQQLAMARQWWSYETDDMDSARSPTASTCASVGQGSFQESIGLFRVGPPGSVLTINSARFVVQRVEPRHPLDAEEPPRDNVEPWAGIADEDTVVFTQREVSPTLAKIRVLPYADTLPTTYPFELFRDYLGPFFLSQPFREFTRRDYFIFQGVRFRVVDVHPAGATARVGLTTEVHCEGEPMQTKLRDLLGPELRRRLSVFPNLMQTVLGHYFVQTRFSHHLHAARGSDANTIAHYETLYWNSDEMPAACCTVCLGEFEDGDELRRLACKHVFHMDCVDIWLARSDSCPVCKQRA